MKKTGAKIKFFKGEKMLALMFLLLLVLTPVVIVFSTSTLSKTNIELEQIKSKITKQTNINDSLNMKINELASLDNIEAVANAKGLSYNNDNIKVIENSKNE